ncbi:hypothetical protein BaRGS_00021422 [Batillaria attramentaria]|uniref:ZBR-type domain-containing protein n=1 Tax=Batillaria attramentaria TaxID=370345 RepID=A0ABD0KJQ0_9CAEN
MAVKQEDLGRISQGKLTCGVARQDGCKTSDNTSSMDYDAHDCDLPLPVPPLPVCTSTPNLPKVCSRLLDSVIPFPKMDDSGFGDTLSLKSTPSLSSDLVSRSTPNVSSQISSIEDLTTDSGITSTPISSIPGTLFGRQLVFSAENPHRGNITDSPKCLPKSGCDCRTRCSHPPHLGGKSFISMRTPHTCEDKLYEICSIWEDEESQDHTDEAYHSASKSIELDGSSQHAELVESFNHALRHFSPPVPSKLIGRRIGVEKVDLVMELHTYGLDVITLLLPYLLPVDVVKMCLVSSQWRQLCLRNHVAHHLHQQYTTAPAVPEDMGKENQVSPSKLRSHKRALTASSGQLAEIQPVDLTGARISIAPTSVVYSSLYDQERKNLRWEEKLRHCPKCHAVAKLLAGQDRGQCLSLQCQSDFCTKCFAPYHYPNACAPILVKKSKTDSVGSKKSRKNLKRL